jgi:hypothetical protein
MMHARNKGIIAEGIQTLRSLWSAPQTNDRYHTNNSRGASWEANHPIGENFMSHKYANKSGGRLAHRLMFSRFVICSLCLHLVLCGLHDIFLRYIAYRNPDGDGEAEVSWNGEGRYIPSYWLSFEGRVLNPCVGPGARTLTGFGALVPGLVVAKGQGWRIGTSLFQTSSLVQLVLHIWALRTVVGGSVSSLEWRRGISVASAIFVISALIGVAWSIALEPGRLITSSDMGIAGLLAAANVDRVCFPDVSKDEGDETGMSNRHGEGSGTNLVTTSSNEQFAFLPPTTQKKKRRTLLNSGSPSLLLLFELLASWWAAYTSLPGTALSAMAGATCALLLFVGNPPPNSFEKNDYQDLLFFEHPFQPPPPPPPPLHWRDDDDSADTSIDAGRQTFNTPLMRRSILMDEDDEVEPIGRSSLRKRYVNGSSGTTPELDETKISTKSKQSFSVSRVIARVVGTLLGLLLIVIPLSLLASAGSPSNEVTRASALGCKPMRILYKDDDTTDIFECAGGCIPLSREQTARRVEGMRQGRCDSIGYRCWHQSGTMTLRKYKVNVGIYVVPSTDGCENTATDEDNGYKNNDDTNA